jgi:Uma2 family endonuclease
MGMPASVTWTPEMVWALPEDGNRYEIFDGALVVTPSPGFPHQVALGRLQFAFYTWAERERAFFAGASPSDIRLGERTMVQPDLYVVPREVARGDFPFPLERVVLAIEVLSPSHRRRDLEVKRAIYARAGVPLYWVVDHRAQGVHVFAPDGGPGTLVHDTLTWHPAGAQIPFSIPVPELFAPI